MHRDPRILLADNRHHRHRARGADPSRLLAPGRQVDEYAAEAAAERPIVQGRMDKYLSEAVAERRAMQSGMADFRRGMRRLEGHRAPPRGGRHTPPGPEPAAAR